MKTGIKNKQNSWAFLKNCMPRAQRCRSVCHLFGNPGDLESVSSKNQESLRWRQNQSGRLWLRTGILVGLVVTERSEIYSLDCNNIRTLIQHKAYIYIYICIICHMYDICIYGGISLCTHWQLHFPGLAEVFKKSIELVRYVIPCSELTSPISR